MAVFAKHPRTFILSKLTTLLLMVIFIFAFSLPSLGQDTLYKRKNFKEWDEILKLRKKFMEGPYGSNYFIGIFDGRFIGPNDKSDYGLRTFTTAYDYLTLGNSLLSLIINMGYGADNSKFLSTKKISHGMPYSLGCIWFYSMAADKQWIDSVYSTKLGRMVPADNPHFQRTTRLKIDSTHVDVELAGLIKKRKEGDKTVWDTLFLPPIEGTGSWKDANNYDLVYEWMEFIFNIYIDSFDISRRQFSKNCPPEIKRFVLERYDTQKYMDQHGLEKSDLEFRIRDHMGVEYFDLLHQPNGKVFKIGNYDVFRFFTEVYWRPSEELVTAKNPIWYCAFQYDKDVEKNSKGLIEFVQLGYGAKDYIMPTVVPRNLPAFTQFEGVVVYQSGAERVSHSNKDDIWINTLNGRMVDRNLYEYPHERGILPLNDDGTVDRIYKIYAWKDKKLYWAYIYCGKHAGVRGGKPGKSFVDQVDNFRRQYDASEYWYFVEELDYQKDVKGNLGKFTKDVSDFANKVTGVSGKTMPRVNIDLSIPNEHNPKKTTEEHKQLVFFSDFTAKLEPEGLIVPWEIEEKTDERLRKTHRIILTILGDKVYIENLDDYLTTKKFSNSEVNRFNKKFIEEQGNYVEVPDSTEKTVEIYDRQAFDLTNSDDTKSLIDRVLMDIAAIDYQIPQTTESIEWQQTKMDKLDKRMADLAMQGQEDSEVYKKLKDEYDRELTKLGTLDDDLTKLEYNKEKLVGKLHQYRSLYIRNLEQNLQVISNKKSFILSQISDLEKNMQTLIDEGQGSSEAYKQMQATLDNKHEEIKEAEIQENDILKVLAEQRNIAEQEN